MKHLFTVTGLAVLLSAPLAAQGYIPNGKLDITPLPNGVRIAGNTGHGARGTWCAAADFALDELGAAGSQNLYVSEPKSPGVGRNSSVSFSLDPTGLQPSNVYITGTSLNRRGAMLTVNHALTFCADLRLPSR